MRTEPIQNNKTIRKENKTMRDLKSYKAVILNSNTAEQAINNFGELAYAKNELKCINKPFKGIGDNDKYMRVSVETTIEIGLLCILDLDTGLAKVQIYDTHVPIGREAKTLIKRTIPWN